MLYLSTVFFLLHAINANADIQKKPFEDYCWRDYEGVIPLDAFQGGRDENGEPIYIGQVLFQDVLILGKIYKDDERIHFEYNDKTYTSAQCIKIFCSKQPQKFKWFQTSNNQILRLTNKTLIKGGYEKDYFTYVGRVRTEGERSVGKVICSDSDCWGLYTTKGETVKVHSNFEILTYNPNINNVSTCRLLIDIRLRGI